MDATRPRTRLRRLLGRLVALSSLIWALGCAQHHVVPPETVLEPVREEPAPLRATPSQIETLARDASVPAPSTRHYAIGPADTLRIAVVGQPELTANYTVGPDGSIALPLAGTLAVGGCTRDEARRLVTEHLAPYFDPLPSVGLDITDYRNNRAYVLGRVEVPGVVELTGNGSLLQALAEAGGLPVREFRSYLAQCAIIRGREEILWIDLTDLLQRGNLALNVPLQNGDVVFIPDSEDTTVFVMGEVENAGAVPVKVRITLTQALAQAGGPTEDADLEEVYLIRSAAAGGPGKPIKVDLRHLLETADFGQDFELQRGDILYVARNGMGDVDYVLRKLSPGGSLGGTLTGVR